MLREQLESVQRKLQRAEERGAEVNKLTMENKELQLRLLRWEGNDGSQGIKSPEELVTAVAELQSSNTLLLEKQGQIQTRLVG